MKIFESITTAFYLIGILSLYAIMVLFIMVDNRKEDRK